MQNRNEIVELNSIKRNLEEKIKNEESLPNRNHLKSAVYNIEAVIQSKRNELKQQYKDYYNDYN